MIRRCANSLMGRGPGCKGPLWTCCAPAAPAFARPSSPSQSQCSAIVHCWLPFHCAAPCPPRTGGKSAGLLGSGHDCQVMEFGGGRGPGGGGCIRGLRRHNQNTFGPTEGQNEQWREANRRGQRQTTEYRGLVLPPPPLCVAELIKGALVQRPQYLCGIRWENIAPFLTPIRLCHLMAVADLRSQSVDPPPPPAGGVEGAHARPSHTPVPQDADARVEALRARRAHTRSEATRADLRWPAKWSGSLSRKRRRASGRKCTISRFLVRVLLSFKSHYWNVLVVCV